MLHLKGRVLLVFLAVSFLVACAPEAKSFKDTKNSKNQKLDFN
jgi:hypothetical protein